MIAPHRIKLEVFEGPLDLLLHLVKINEMDIVDIRIADVAKQYMDYLMAMQEMDLEIAGDYLVMAATLLNIKSRALLPANPDEEGHGSEEEIDEILSTRDLIRRLVEYRKVKELAAELRAREEEASRLFRRTNFVLPMAPGADELPRQDILTLFDALAEVLKRVRVVAQHNVVNEPYTVEEKLDELRAKIAATRQINLSRVFDACVSKVEVVCYFLAVLEMARLREITLAQAGTFDDILIEPWEAGAAE